MIVRYLSQREAERCEEAREPVCKCRCGGAKHGAGRVPGGDFSSLPMDDPHYRPPMNRAHTLRFLRHARDLMTFPRLVDRDTYVHEFGWELWTIQRHQEEAAFHDAQQILEDAIRQVKA